MSCNTIRRTKSLDCLDYGYFSHQSSRARSDSHVERECHESENLEILNPQFENANVHQECESSISIHDKPINQFPSRATSSGIQSQGFRDQELPSYVAESENSAELRLREKELELQTAHASIEKLVTDHQLLQKQIKVLQKLLTKTHKTNSYEYNHPIFQSSTNLSQNAVRLKLKKTNCDTVTRKHVNPRLCDDTRPVTFPLSDPTVTTALAEQLTYAIQTESMVREMEQMSQHIPNEIHRLDNGMKPKPTSHNHCQFQLEALKRRLDSVKCEKHVLTLNLEEAKNEAGQLSLVVPQFEANIRTLCTALRISNETVEVYDILVALLESELEQVLAHCFAAGITNAIVLQYDDAESMISSESRRRKICAVLDNANAHRATAEKAAYSVISRKQYFRGSSHNSYDEQIRTARHGSRFRDQEATSRDRGSVSSNGIENAIRTLIIDLKTESKRYASTVKNCAVFEVPEYYFSHRENSKSHKEKRTIRDIESEARRMELERGVLLQELMSAREEQVALRKKLYFLEKDNIRLKQKVKELENLPYSGN